MLRTIDTASQLAGRTNRLSKETGSVVNLLKLIRNGLHDTLREPSVYQSILPNVNRFLSFLGERSRVNKMNKRRKRRIVGYIFRTWIRRKDGSRDYACTHGFKAWRIPVYAD